MKNSKVQLEVPENQLILAQNYQIQYEELVAIIERKVLDLILLVNPNDLSPKFPQDEPLLETCYKFTREIEKRIGGTKMQNYEASACKNFNTNFDSMEKILVQTNSDSTTKSENNFIFDINRVFKINEFFTNGKDCLLILANLQDFQSVLEHLIDQGEKNLVYEYNSEMDGLELILNENDKFMDRLEEKLKLMVED